MIDRIGARRWCVLAFGALLLFGSCGSWAQSPAAVKPGVLQATSLPNGPPKHDAPTAARRPAEHAAAEPSRWLDPVHVAVDLTWPLIALLLIVFLWRSNKLWDFLGSLAKRVSQIGPVSFASNTQEAEKQKEFYQKSFGELNSNAMTQYDLMQEASNIGELLRKVVDTGLPEVLAAIGKSLPPAKFRATIHVPDVIFNQILYQLVDYYPPQLKGGRGRRFSMRYGIIGRSWRLGESVGEGQALDPPPEDASEDARKKWKVVERKLISEWGMLPHEAAQGSHGRPSYLCVILRSQAGLCAAAGENQGLLFIDSENQDVFGTGSSDEDSQANKVAKTLESHATCKALAKEVAKIMKALNLRGPHLQVEDK